MKKKWLWEFVLFPCITKKTTPVDPKLRPFYNGHGDNISGVCIFIHISCTCMKFGLGAYNSTNN